MLSALPDDRMGVSRLFHNTDSGGQLGCNCKWSLLPVLITFMASAARGENEPPLLKRLPYYWGSLDDGELTLLGTVGSSH